MRSLPALLLGALALPVAAGPVGEWAIVGSPNSSLTPTHNALTATTCVAADDCWAVGYYSSTVATYQSLIQHWDGGSWSVVPSPNSGVTQGNVLRGVACVAANDCWAVGSYSEPASPQRTLILHWDGSAWSLVASPNSGPGDYNYLFGVHCAAASDCWAVGYRSAGSGFQTLALRWDGTAWTVASSPNAGGAQQTFLEGVHCASAADCWAVGWFVQAGTGFNQTFVLRWNGTAWAAVASPNALAATHGDLHGVACVSASDCWAAGSAEVGGARQTLVLRWNGGAWAVVGSPSTTPTGDNFLRGVACASAAQCVAIGSQDTGSGARTLTLRWDGSAWAVAASPNAGSADNTLFGAACAPGGGCWAAGFHLGAGLQQSLALRWQGGDWAIAATPNRFAPQNNTLLGVACPSADACWAVASYYNGSVQQTLIERWDGAAWSVHPSPNTATTESNILYDVSCVAADDCWVVGYALGATGWRTLIQHWDGAAWAIVESPSVPGGNNFLNDVACVSASECWAVGFHDAGVYQTLILRWDGSQWAIVESPNTDLASENRLSGVSCASAGDCWAVGFHKVEGFLQRTLVVRWDGVAWSIAATPNTDATRNNFLEDVACESPTRCWAVGAFSPGAVGTGQPLILGWDGSDWTVADAPQPPGSGQNSYLRGVTCPAPSDCWAVGDSFTGGSAQTLIERWDGTAWKVFASPNTAASQPNRLVGIACRTPGDCWSVGYFTSDAGIFHTLTLRYAGAPEPDPFGFADRTGVATSAWITSGSVTLTGFDGLLPVTVDDGGQHRINAGAWTATPGQVAAGDRLSVRHVSADTAHTERVSTVTVGSRGAAFRSVTSATDRTPDAFGFGTVTGVEGGAPATSDPVEIRGFNTPLSIAPGPGVEYRVGQGSWTSDSGTLPYTTPWTTVTVRHVASSTPLGYTRSYLKIGGVAGYFTTRTR